MSFKSSMRSIAAAQRRVERESRRRQRELDQQRKELAKMQEFERAKYEVEVYENYLDVILSVHKECGPNWDWKQIAQKPPPIEPVRITEYEKKATKSFEAYEPRFVDKLLRRTEAKKAKLELAIKEGIQRDVERYEADKEKYEIVYRTWEEQQDIGKRIVSGDLEAYIEVIRSLASFSELSDLGSSVEISIVDTKVVEATFFPHSEEVIPKESKSLLKSGKLSVKNTPKTRFFEMYQDYICGCTLRISRELFALLPVDMVIVTAISPLLNTRTGQMEEKPILSVAIPHNTLKTLNFGLLDPSDSMSNFVFNMSFQKTKGFKEVERITPSDFHNT